MARRNPYNETIHEYHVYGTMHRTGCTKQRPTTYGKVYVRTTTNDHEEIVVSEPVTNVSEARAFVNKILTNYRGRVIDVMQNVWDAKKRELKVYEAIVSDVNRRIMFAKIEIIAA